jgi:membrane protease YdiL (CAAX protease family)
VLFLSGHWAKVPIFLRAIAAGLLIALPAANVWPLLLINLGAPFAAIAEAIFLALYIWWTAGGGPPRAWQKSRANSFHRGPLSAAQWLWGIVAALCFAVTIHASIVLLFRFVAFPVAEFRQGYDFSFIPTVPLRWLAIVISAASAGICEETGFRGYMQRPIELSHGAPLAILISSLFFTVLHLTKGWALAGMIPIIFGAGILLGSLALSAGSLIPGMIGHTIMDVGLFAYWWTGIAGEFTLRPIGETGVDRAFVIACVAAPAMLTGTLLAIWRLRSLRQSVQSRNVH